MSVIIKKREEKRNTPLYTFLAVAAIPLILFLLGGMALGRGGSESAAHWKEKHDAVVLQRDSLEIANKQLIEFSNTLDSLRKVFDKGFLDFYDKLPDIYSSGMVGVGGSINYGGKLETWHRQRGEFFGEWNRKSGELKSNIRSNPNTSIALDQKVSFFQKYIEKHSAWLNEHQLFQIQGEKLGYAAVNSTQIQQLEDQIRTLEADKTKLELDVRIARLDCQNQTGSSSEITKQLIEAENKLAVCKAAAIKTQGKIQQEIQSIRDQIIPALNASTLNFSQANSIERLKSLLSEKMNTMDGLCRELSL